YGDDDERGTDGEDASNHNPLPSTGMRSPNRAKWWAEFRLARRHRPEKDLFAVDARRLLRRPVANRELVGDDPCARPQLTPQFRLQPRVEARRHPQRHDR